MNEESPRIDPITIMQENIIREIRNVVMECPSITLGSIVGALEFIKNDLINGDFYAEDDEDDEEDDGEEWKRGTDYE